MNRDQSKLKPESLSEGERAMFDMAVKWLEEHPRSHEEIALKIVKAATTTYRLTKEQAASDLVKNAMAQRLVRDILR